MLACKDETDDNNFREDVILCEDAISWLTSCCGGTDLSKARCDYFYSYNENACGPDTENSKNPALNREESLCVRDKTCDEIRAKKICERTAAAFPYEKRQSTRNCSSLPLL